jgi:high-affinity iron transporter
MQQKPTLFVPGEPLMLPTYLLSLREGLEAALIVGIVLGALRQMRRTDLALAVWGGVLGAVLVSVFVAVVLTSLGLSLQDPAEAIFEGFTMLLAMAVLTWMIFWMNGQSRQLKSELEAGVRQAALASGQRGLFMLAFLAVVREGVELALFLTAATFAADAVQTLTGTLLGLFTSILLGWSLFATSVKLDLRRFFQVTGFLLILFAAGMASRGVSEFVEVGWLPALIEHVWDLNPILSETSGLGQILSALFGYASSPSLMAVLTYVGYFVTIGVGLRLARKSEVASVQTQA